MDFNLSEDQIAFRDAARSFAQNEMAPHAAQWDAEHIFPIDVIKKAGEMGFCGIYVPEEAGGMGLSRLDASVIIEELAMGCTSTTAYITIHNMATWMIASFAAEDLRDEFAPGMAMGEKLGSYCLTEPGAGSDAGALRSTARRDGDDYVLNGSKIWTTHGHYGKYMILLARTNPDAPNKYAGLSFLLCPMDVPGIETRKIRKLTGEHGFTQTFFTDARIPADGLMGREGEGWKIAMQTLEYERGARGGQGQGGGGGYSQGQDNSGGWNDNAAPPQQPTHEPVANEDIPF